MACGEQRAHPSRCLGRGWGTSWLDVPRFPTSIHPEAASSLPQSLPVLFFLFSNHLFMCVCVCVCVCVYLCTRMCSVMCNSATPWTAAHQAP